MKDKQLAEAINEAFRFTGGDNNPYTKVLLVSKIGGLMPTEARRERLRVECGITAYRWVQNLMSRKWVLESKDTPHCCSVGSETYWSM